MKRSTVWILIASAFLVVGIGAFTRIDFTLSDTRKATETARDGTACTARTLSRLADALVEVANAFEAPPAPNADRAAAVTMIREKADAMARQAKRCVVQNR